MFLSHQATDITDWKHLSITHTHTHTSAKNVCFRIWPQIQITTEIYSAFLWEATTFQKI